MTIRISDLHIAREDMLPAPLTLREKLPCGEAQAAHIAGVLLESHLAAGGQDTVAGRTRLRYGQGVTDGCIGWDDTVAVLDGLSDAMRSRAAKTR